MLPSFKCSLKFDGRCKELTGVPICNFWLQWLIPPFDAQLQCQMNTIVHVQAVSCFNPTASLFTFFHLLCDVSNCGESPTCCMTEYETISWIHMVSCVVVMVSRTFAVEMASLDECYWRATATKPVHIAAVGTAQKYTYTWCWSISCPYSTKLIFSNAVWIPDCQPFNLTTKLPTTP